MYLYRSILIVKFFFWINDNMKFSITANMPLKVKFLWEKVQVKVGIWLVGITYIMNFFYSSKIFNFCCLGTIVVW